MRTTPDSARSTAEAPSTGAFRRWIAASALWIVLPTFGLFAADEEQVRWVKLDEARAKSILTGKPVLVLCITDLLPDGPPTKGIDRSFTSELVRPQRDEFLFVKCTDMSTVKAVKATSKSEMIFFDPDGEELHRTVVKCTQDIADAMKVTLTRYANQPIRWTSEPPAPVERSPDGRKLTVVLFRSASEDVEGVIRSLEDRSVSKFHSRCAFVSMEYRLGSETVAKWTVVAAPTLLLLDAEKEFGPKAVLDRTSGRKTPREVRGFLRKGLAEIEKSHRK
jgi:hypothetical protein